MTRLVYTSTYNVVFGGQEIRNGDHLEILPDHKVTDLYTVEPPNKGRYKLTCFVLRREVVLFSEVLNV